MYLNDIRRIQLDNRIENVYRKFVKSGVVNGTPREVSLKTQQSKERPSLIKKGKIYTNYKHFTLNNFLLDGFSSGEDTESDEELKEASMQDVVSSTLDFNTIRIIHKIEDFPNQVKPSLIFTNLEDWVSESNFKQFIVETPCFIKENIIPEIVELKKLIYNNQNYAMVKFTNSSYCEKLLIYYNHPYKKNQLPTRNSKGEIIELFLAYDLLDFTLSYWYALVVRNLPLNCTVENLKKNCESFSKSVLYATPLTKVKNSLCSIVVVGELDEAEKLCQVLNKKEVIKGRKLKVHLHPRGCKIRRNQDKSILKNILVKKDNINFPENLQFGWIIIQKSITFNVLMERIKSGVNFTTQIPFKREIVKVDLDLDYEEVGVLYEVSQYEMEYFIYNMRNIIYFNNSDESYIRKGKITPSVERCNPNKNCQNKTEKIKQQSPELKSNKDKNNVKENYYRRSRRHMSPVKKKYKRSRSRRKYSKSNKKDREKIDKRGRREKRDSRYNKRRSSTSSSSRSDSRSRSKDKYKHKKHYSRHY